MQTATPSLAQLCTLRVGGRPRRYLRSDDAEELVSALGAADEAKEPVLWLGGGSNTVPSDDEFPGLVMQDARRAIRVMGRDEVRSWIQEHLPETQAEAHLRPNQVLVRAQAGLAFDNLVEWSVAQGFAGLEALSGIPGCVGAAPVQNIGAYGSEIANVLFGVEVWDRQSGKMCYLTRSRLECGYRQSALKASQQEPERWRDAGVLRGGREATGRWIVLEVDVALDRAQAGSPVAYAQLAKALDVPLGGVVPAKRVREAVLGLRRAKGMVLDEKDHDTWSVGSFFTNPIVPGNSPLLLELPSEAPRWEVSRGADAASEGKGGHAVKLSAAWLIEHAGVSKGFMLPGSRAGISTKHVLALTNRGEAKASQIRELASYVVKCVRDTWGIVLVPEPVFL